MTFRAGLFIPFIPLQAQSLPRPPTRPAASPPPPICFSLWARDLCETFLGYGGCCSGHTENSFSGAEGDKQGLSTPNLRTKPTSPHTPFRMGQYQCTKCNTNSAAGQWSCAKSEESFPTCPTLALPAVWMMLPFGLPSGQTFTHTSELLACLSNHSEMMRRSPQRREGLWNGAVDLCLQMKITFQGQEGECRDTPLCSSACLIPFKDGTTGFPAPERCSRLKAHQTSPLCSGTDGSFRPSS